MRYQWPLLIASAAALGLAACSGDTSGRGRTAGDTDTVAAPLGTFGDPCDQDTDCGTGLCLSNQYAPFKWCSAACTQVKEPCAPDSEGVYGGYCVALPDDFPDTPRRFCVPVCKDIFECQGKSPLWEECGPLQWKGNPIYGEATDVRACQAPSSHGQVKVDPTTCANWQAGFAGFQSQIATCEAYCDYLVTCKEVPQPAAYNQACCAYGCTLAMTQGGEIQVPYEKVKKCYVQNFYAFQGTPLVCQQPLDDCGKSPEDPAP